MAVVQSNDREITQREKQINDIATSIMTLAEIFKELQTMVFGMSNARLSIKEQCLTELITILNRHL